MKKTTKKTDEQKAREASAYFGRKGGMRTYRKHGKDQMREMGLKSGRNRRRRIREAAAKKGGDNP